MQKIAIIGAGGQLGRELRLLLGDRAIPLLRSDLDLTDRESIATVFDRHRPDGVINAAAYNLVDQAEAEPMAAFAVNSLGPANLARESAQRGIPCVHVSTDYVFGRDAHRETPFRELDRVDPVNAYGVSKAAGEMLVRQTTEQHLIVRTCGLYGQPSEHGKGNFVRTIRRLATTKDEISVVNDQRCTPTCARDLASAIVGLLNAEQWGTYHATNSGDCSWFEFASEIVRLLGLPTRVLPCRSEQFPRPARRPAYSVLDTSKLSAAIGRTLPDWKHALAQYLGRDEVS